MDQGDLKMSDTKTPAVVEETTFPGIPDVSPTEFTIQINGPGVNVICQTSNVDLVGMIIAESLKCAV
jgi:hypothetical protein